ncbi:MAG: hypothetical protein GC184_13615 [Rhizobiales bacterium]|nr:hypothetical protein [Hyphomicrobiales bacterium]
MTKQCHIIIETIDWQGIALSVAYEPNWLSMEGEYTVAHLQIEAVAPERAPLPITETGYRSHFLSPEEITEAGGAVAYARAWLDYAAQSPEWRKHMEAARQMSLF